MRLRKYRNQEKMRKWRLYRRPPRWSKRWWFNLSGKIIESPHIAWIFITVNLIERPTRWIWKSELVCTFSVFRCSSPRSEYLDRWLWIKISRAANAEMIAMRFVRAHTSIPVPRPYFAFKWQWTWLVMERIPGVTLESVWYKSTAEEKDNYVHQLHTMIGDKICSASGGSFVELRIRINGPCGPFLDENEFNIAITGQLRPPRPSREQMCHHIRHPIVFTHGDMTMRNIMVKDGRITAVIDWETAAWLPAHWEYIKAHSGNWEHEDRVGTFREYTDKAIPAYPEELAPDRAWVLPHWNPGLLVWP